MTWLLLAPWALAGSLHIDAKIPTEVFVGNQAIAQLYYPGKLQVEVGEGDARVVVMTNGNPHPFDVTFGEEPVVLLVGKSGISFGEATRVEPAEDLGPPVLEMRSTASETLMIQIGGTRTAVGPGEVVHRELAVGEHSFSVRSQNATAIYSMGILALSGGPVVVQLAEGLMPEFVGAGAQYRPNN